MEKIKLPEDFLMGCGTSAVQIEGGDMNNNWYMWCEQGRIKDGGHCVIATDHWNKYKEDIDLMKQMNQETYRMGIEWSRIEPEQGKFCREAVAHYREEISYLLQKQIRPLVTLYHFSHPLWFSKLGEWESPQAVDCFDRFAEFVALHLGDLVTDWVTINEPSAYILAGFAAGIWPPGKQNFISVLKVAHNMILGHVKAYKTIHRVRREQDFKGRTKVGFAMHLRVFEPYTDTWLNGLQVRIAYRVAQDMLMEGMSHGKLVPPLGWGHYPLGRGRYYEFIGVNYYSRDVLKVTSNPKMCFTDICVKEGAEVNAVGWEIYPEGIYRVCKEYYERYRAPIYITENGCSDCQDEKRSKFIYEHLKYVSKAISEGVPIKRYYYWTLVDNFEFLEGMSARYGLVHNDFETQRRSIKKSGLFYSEICKRKAVTVDMIERYLMPEPEEDFLEQKDVSYEAG